MSWFRLVSFLLLLYVAFLFYVPVPDKVNQKLQYRSVSAMTKFSKHLATLYSCFVPGTTGQVKITRKLFDITRKWVLPSGKIYGPGVHLSVESFDGVKVHVYTPPAGISQTLLPGLIYIHGGGLGLFDPEHYDGLTRKMCMELNAVVISIDYRLTPEHVFPIPFEDSFKATKWFLLHAVDYNVDAERVAIGGDSAGGYLSTTVAQAIHDDATTHNLKLQVLLYPWLQILDLKTPSYQKYRHEIGSEGIIPLEIVALFAAMHVYGLQTNETILKAFMTNNHISEEFKQSTLYKEKLSHSLLRSKHRDYPYYQPPTKSFPQSDDGRRIWEESSEVFLDPKLSPLLMEDLTGMPVTYIVTVEYDSIRDDGIIYGKLLEQAGVDVTWRHYDNAFHGIIWVAPGIIFEDGSKIMEEVYTFVRSKL